MHTIRISTSRVITVALLSLLVLLASASLSCKSDYPASGKAASADKTQPRQVRTVKVTEMPIGQTVTVNGTLAAYDHTTVGIKVPGRLQTISIDLGTVVHKGQPIAQVEQQDYKLRVQQAEASLSQARARLGLSPDGSNDRVTAEETGTVRQARAVLEDAKSKRDRAGKLVQQGVIPRAEYDTVDSEYKVALSRYQDGLEEIRNRQGVLAQRRSEVALAKQQLADTIVYAPMEGVVQEKKASVGEYLAAGAPVVDIVRIDPLRLRVDVPEREAHSIRNGQSVRVTVEGDAESYLGFVKRLSPTISEQSRALAVEADVRNNGRLRPGAFVRAEIVTDQTSTAVTVPLGAVVTFAGIDKVILIENGKAVEKTITTGRRGPDWIEIKAGVNVGQSVILDPGNLQAGQSVTTNEGQN
ncbi:MAG TPA: efflux RND transporter periplasmic adaptor subunit [Pyrinomonadaceae bacterium]|nr:efflux RND transporter periplasmic adaptor subunit [Pyrinomonadaceae bacterium]